MICQRCLADSARALLRSAARRSATEQPPVRRIDFKRSISTSLRHRYPRQATPFSSSQQSNTTEAASSPTTADAEPWYLSETPDIPSLTTRFAQPEKIAPAAPALLPDFLHPLWIHLHESPFIDVSSITSVDSRATSLAADVQDMDASVSSWVDWVAIATLKQGRERGIRGAADAVAQTLKASLSSHVTQANLSASELPRPRVRIEGLDIADPKWCLIDGDRVIVHIMTEQARATWEVDSVATATAGQPLLPLVPHSMQGDP